MPRLQNDATSIRKLNLVGNKTYAVSLPIEIVRQLGWQKGNTLVVRRQGQIVTVEKASDEEAS